MQTLQNTFAGIPLISAEEAPEGQLAPATVGILLVDDDSRNLDVLESILEPLALRCLRATTPEDALLALVREDFACIVLDIQMPNMSGLELARLIKTRKRCQNVPIIFLTAYFLEEQDILQGYGAGAVDYLTKPINPQILKSKVSVFVDLFRTARALEAANGALEMVIVQRRAAEEALRAANKELEISGQRTRRQLAAIVEYSHDAIISKDTEGVVTSWNKGAERLFGYASDEAIGRCITFLIPPERFGEEAEILARIQHGETIHHYETIRRRKDGTMLDISLTVSPIKDDRGKIVGASKIARDITERKLIEQDLKRTHDELLAASRAKDNFIAMLSHELRTPLNPILLIASEAANDRELPPRVRTHFETIRKSVELEARLIDDLLDLTRVTRGKVLLEKQILDVHQVLKEAVANLREEMDRQQLALELKLNAPRRTVFADAVRLQQIFLNLLKNAIKFTPAGGQIRVDCDVNEDQFVIRIADTGVGMQPEEIPGIFTAFAQGNHANDGGCRLGGLGLGLAISQRLAELHSGTIQAASDGPGKGSTFTVKLPLAQGDAIEKDAADVSSRMSAEVRPELPARGRGLRILLVEDHEPTRIALTQLLLRRRYEVASAATLAEARRLAGAQSFNLLISDIGLPDGNGCELMAEFRKQFALPGIALTGYGTEQDVARSHEAGFGTHLTKPVRAESLDNALASILNGRT